MSILVIMKNIIYCIGNSDSKRRAFRQKGCGQHSLYIENDEVALDIVVDNNSYFINTKLPFAKFTVYQYIIYQTSLFGRSRLTRNKIKLMLQSVGAKFSINQKIASLTKIEYRQMLLSYKITFNTHTVYLNCDGIEFNKKNLKQLNVLLDALSKTIKVFVAVSDSRFTNETELLYIYGVTTEPLIIPATYQRAGTINPNKIIGVIKSRNMPLNIRDITSVVKVVGE